MWSACRATVTPLTAEAWLGDDPPVLPTTWKPAARSEEARGSLLIARLDGWWLDGTPVRATLPPRDRILLAADEALPATDVARLMRALHETGADVWKVLRTERPPDGSTAAPRLTSPEWMAQCRPGRRLLEPGPCDDLARLWRRVHRSTRCRAPYPTDEERARVTPHGTWLALEPLHIDPSNPRYWTTHQTFADLRSDEGWVAVGLRPADEWLPVTRLPPVTGRLISQWPGRCLRREVCRLTAYIDRDGRIDRVENTACPPFLFEDVANDLVARRFETPAGGSERPARVAADVTFHVCADEPTVDPSRTARRQVIVPSKLPTRR